MCQKTVFTQTGAVLCFLVLCLSACSPLIGPYSPTAYKYATSLKAETLALMSKAKEPYAKHAAKTDALFVEFHKAHEYVKGVPGNSISAAQWAILIKEDGDLAGKFFMRWKERTTLSPAYIQEFKKLISDAFDEIICLEANKKSASKCKPS